MARHRIELRLQAYEAQAPNHGPRDEINVGGSGGNRARVPHQRIGSVSPIQLKCSTD